jgi:hypothetical protein
VCWGEGGGGGGGGGLELDPSLNLGLHFKSTYKKATGRLMSACMSTFIQSQCKTVNFN